MTETILFGHWVSLLLSRGGKSTQTQIVLSRSATTYLKKYYT